MDVCARVDQLGRQAQCFRSRIRVLEAAGVRDQRDVERLRDLWRDLEAELREDVAQHLPRRGCVRNDQVDGPEARVVVMVVDIDYQRRALQRLWVGADTAFVGTVERQQHALAPVVRQPPPQLGQRHERVLRGKRGVPVEVHDAVFAELVERELHRQDRAERVAVGVLVRDDEKAVVRPDRVRDRR